MALGILLGTWAIPVGGGVLKLGSAAGTLLVGLVLGRVGRIGPVVTAMPYTAAQAVAELGLLVFLAQAGSRAGAQIGDAFTSGEWLRILALGVVVTSVVAGGLYVVMRRVFAVGGTRLSGIMTRRGRAAQVLRGPVGVFGGVRAQSSSRRRSDSGRPDRTSTTSSATGADTSVTT